MGYRWNRLDELVLMAGAEPLLTLAFITDRKVAAPIDADSVFHNRNSGIPHTMYSKGSGKQQ